MRLEDLLANYQFLDRNLRNASSALSDFEASLVEELVKHDGFTEGKTYQVGSKVFRWTGNRVEVTDAPTRVNRLEAVEVDATGIAPVTNSDGANFVAVDENLPTMD